MCTNEWTILNDNMVINSLSINLLCLLTTPLMYITASQMCIFLA